MPMTTKAKWGVAAGGAVIAAAILYSIVQPATPTADPLGEIAFTASTPTTISINPVQYSDPWIVKQTNPGFFVVNVRTGAFREYRLCQPAADSMPGYWKITNDNYQCPTKFDFDGVRLATDVHYPVQASRNNISAERAQVLQFNAASGAITYGGNVTFPEYGFRGTLVENPVLGGDGYAYFPYQPTGVPPPPHLWKRVPYAALTGAPDPIGMAGPGTPPAVTRPTNIQGFTYTVVLNGGGQRNYKAVRAGTSTTPTVTPPVVTPGTTPKPTCTPCGCVITQ